MSPLSVKFVHSFDRETKEKKISVETSALTASISPHTVHIFLNIVKGGKATWKVGLSAGGDIDFLSTPLFA